MKKTPEKKMNLNAYDDFLGKVIVGIGEVSEITGVPVRKLRYWQEKGIITPIDQNATSRQFNLTNVKKVVLIQELLEDGYTLDAAATKVNTRLERINSILGLLSFTRDDIVK